MVDIAGAPPKEAQAVPQGMMCVLDHRSPHSTAAVKRWRAGAARQVATRQSTREPSAGRSLSGSEQVEESADNAGKNGATISDPALPVAQARPAFPAGFELTVEIALQFFEEALPTGLVLVLQYIFKERDNFSQLILGQISPGSQIV